MKGPHYKTPQAKYRAWLSDCLSRGQFQKITDTLLDLLDDDDPKERRQAATTLLQFTVGFPKDQTPVPAVNVNVNTERNQLASMSDEQFTRYVASLNAPAIEMQN